MDLLFQTYLYRFTGPLLTTYRTLKLQKQETYRKSWVVQSHGRHSKLLTGRQAVGVAAAEVHAVPTGCTIIGSTDGCSNA